MMPGQTTNPAIPAPSAVIPSPVPPGFQIPSMVDPDTMEQYGMPDKFNATILLVRAVPYDFFRLRRQLKAKLDIEQGKTPKPIGGRDGYNLSVAVYLVPDSGQGYETNMSNFRLPLTNGTGVEFQALEPSYYNAVSLFQFVPSNDGVNPSGAPFDSFRDLAEGRYHITKEGGAPYEHDDLLAYSGPFMAPSSGYNPDGTIKGSHRGVDQGGDWAHFIDSCVNSGLRISPADWQAKGLAAFEGHRGRFDRIKVKNKGKSEGEHELLLMTSYLGSVSGGAAATAATPAATPAAAMTTMAPMVGSTTTAQAAAPAPVSASPAVDPLIIEFIRSTLAAAGGKAAVPTIISKVAGYPGFSGRPDLIGLTYPILYTGTPPEIAARFASIGFGYNPATQEAALPGVAV